MVLTYDVGSIPFLGDFERFIKGSKAHPLIGLLGHTDPSADRGYFEDKVVEGFVDKVRAGISAPNYPQFRDMNEMFLNQIDGIVKTANGYNVSDRPILSRKNLEIPEVSVIKERAREVYEMVGGPFTLKVCVTGPYTLASMFVYRRSQLFAELGDIITKFVESNVFSGKFCRVALVAVDEPVFGLADDSILDYGCGGREALLKAWETIFHEIKSNGAQSIIHLHISTNDLFWQIKSLDIIESHVGDPIYSSPKTKGKLEESDKLLKASVCVTDFDGLIKNAEMYRGVVNEGMISQKIADVWTRIRKGEVDPTTFLESTDLILNRLRKIVQQYGERVPYAGPECGMSSFPTYGSAIECLRRVSEATKLLAGL